MNYDLYFFDFDNTLTKNPLEINYKKIKDLLCNIIGKYDDFIPIIDKIYQYDANVKNFKKNAFEIIDNYEVEAIYKASVDENIKKIYENIPQNKKIIISRNGEKCIKQFLILHNLELPCVICSRDNIYQLKPNIEAFDYIKNKLGDISQLKILMIGDSIHDELFAKNCDIHYKNKKNCQ